MFTPTAQSQYNKTHGGTNTATARYIGGRLTVSIGLKTLRYAVPPKDAASMAATVANLHNVKLEWR